MVKIITIANQKGGVGKTATAINVAATIAAAGKSVLLIDGDPQANTTAGLGINSKSNGLYKALGRELIGHDDIINTSLPNLYLMPANEDLIAFDMESFSQLQREYKMRHMLQTLNKKFDYIFIDCPPALNMLTINSLCCSQFVIVPMQCEFFALQGLAYLLRNIERIRRNFNNELRLMGVVLTMYDKRNNLSVMVEQDVRSYLKDRVFGTVIPRNVKVSESTSHGKPLIFYDFKSPASQAYLKLSREIIMYHKEVIYDKATG
jgi:chromosome partitioning protein